ncbi:MAG: ABC transporter substrate-binding protein [Candidatus Choladocola sp.]|nr:ABC transporter substrate-binding protein [Candidatus Choladocola sp.]
MRKMKAMGKGKMMTGTKGKKLAAIMVTAVMALTLLSGCTATEKKEDADTITVYLWSSALYDDFAPYVQAQLPELNVEFIVGNNDLDFYKFMNEHGQLPDIITCRRFSLHDAADLKDQLMDLSTTEVAGAIYESYIGNFTNADGTINWLPVCGTVDGFVANRGLFEAYGIPLPTDYDSMVSACRAFEEKGIRGFVADFAYDYTCMEVLQGLSIPEITSMKGRMWRSSYEDPSEDTTGLDSEIWPGIFERMEQFITDVDIRPEDPELSYDPVIEMFAEGSAAVIRGGGANVIAFQNSGIDAVFLPYYGPDGEQWLLTYPEFQVALNRDLEKDKKRREKAMQVLNVMLSEESQNNFAEGEDVITYSQDIDLQLSPYLDNLKPLINQNHLYIRIASNDFFAVSKDVVTKMIQGEYDAEQAYESFDAQLRETKHTDDMTVLSVSRDYSRIFHRKGGNEAYSAMANSLRGYYGSDVLIAPAYSFTGSVFKADYTEKMAGNMIMPNPLEAYHCEMNGAKLKEYVKAYVEGFQEGFTPFNRGSLPVVSGLQIEVREADGTYALERVLKEGKEIGDEDTFQVTCLNTRAYMNPLLNDDTCVFEMPEKRVKDEWISYVKDGGKVAEPEDYITLK